MSKKKWFNEVQEALFEKYITTGDEDAYKELYPSLRVLAISIIGGNNYHVPLGITDDELIEDTIEFATRRFQKFDGAKGKLSSWLHLIMSRYVYNRWNDNKAKGECLVSIEALDVDDEDSSAMDYVSSLVNEEGEDIPSIITEDFKEQWQMYWENYQPIDAFDGRVKHLALSLFTGQFKMIKDYCAFFGRAKNHFNYEVGELRRRTEELVKRYRVYGFLPCGKGIGKHDFSPVACSHRVKFPTPKKIRKKPVFSKTC